MKIKSHHILATSMHFEKDPSRSDDERKFIMNSTTQTKTQPEYHVTDLFFFQELDETVGGDVGQRWLTQQSRSACNADRDRNLYRTKYQSTWTSKLTTSDSSRFSLQATDQDLPHMACLAMDEDLPFKADVNIVEDLGLLFTDAAHAVLDRLKPRRCSSNLKRKNLKYEQRLD